MNNKKCFLCLNQRARVSGFSEAKESYSVKCETCGTYGLEAKVIAKLEESNLSRINCLSGTISNANQRHPFFWLYDFSQGRGLIDEKKWYKKNFSEIKDQPIVHAHKPRKILKLLSEKLESKMPFDRIPFTIPDMYKIKIESHEEAFEWLARLRESKFIKAFKEHRYELYTNDEMLNYVKKGNISFSITPEGWQRIFDLYQQQKSNLVFVAQSFNPEIRDQIYEPIKAACQVAGYEAQTVDSTEYNDGIADEIIRKINTSKFVVVELTENKNGTYWEAGYAEGLGLPTIYCVRQDHLKGGKLKNILGVHFDVQHLNIITWNEEKELQRRLLNRIKATIQPTEENEI